jgi:hypothetical protein
MKTAKVIFFTLALSFLAVACKTESCGCPTQQKKYYKQYSEVIRTVETNYQQA